MAIHAIWKATLRVGDQQLGVKLYSAVREQVVRFRLLHKKGLVPVQQRMAHPETGETVATDDVKRAVEVQPGRFVVVDPRELADLDAATTRNIEVTRFVPESKLDVRYYERPYWLGPEKGESERYFALVQALEKTNREGIARWSMRKREYVGALRADNGYLCLVVLRHHAEVLPLAELAPPTGRAIDERERKLGRQLIAALSGKFDLDEFHEEYRDRVLALVQAKRKGKRLRVAQFKPRRVDDASLVWALERSVRRAA